MTESFAVIRARLGAAALHAKYTKAEVCEFTAKARAAQLAKREAEVIAKYDLDRSAQDFQSRLEHGLEEYYLRMRLARRARGSKSAARGASNSTDR